MNSRFTMKDKVLKVSVGIILLLLIGGGLFYWYEWKPSKIGERCLAEAEFNSVHLSDSVLRQQAIDDYYRNCTRRFGLEEF